MSQQPPEGVHVAIERADGSLAIMFFITRQQRNGDDPGWTREASDEQINAEITKAFPDGSAQRWHRIGLENLPQDRTFRDAWRIDRKRKAIGVEMEKAREIHRQNLRAARAPLFADLDLQYLRALERNDEAELAQIVARKTQLRDITTHPEIAHAKTPDELKQAALAELAV